MLSKKKQLRIKNETTIKELFNIFLSSRIVKGAQDKTINGYKGHFAAMGHYINFDKDISEFEKEDIERMIVAMRTSGLSPNSIKSYLITLRAFVNWCHEEQYCHITVPQYKGRESVKEPYSDEELAKLLKKPNLKHCSFAEYRNWVMINFLLNSGCRAATLRTLQIQDIDLNSSLAYYRHTKNSKVQTIPLCQDMAKILQEYMRRRKGNLEDPLFCTEFGEQFTESGLHGAIARYNRSRGVSKTSVHLFRHTFAKKYLLECDGNAFTLQRLLGHSTLEMTKHYCAIYNKDIIQRYDEISPLAVMNKKKAIRIK